MAALTDTDLQQIYTNGILPSSPPGPADRESNGILKQNTINMIVENLKRSGVIPKVTNNDDYEAFVRKQEKLLNDIKDEYDFYELRYKTGLRMLLNTIKDSYLNNTADNEYIIKSKLSIVQTLNRKLNDLTQIINGVTEDMLASTSGIEDKIKEFDKKNKEHQQKLQEQNRIISSSQASTELNKRMVKYTEEKAKYSNNLLGLYSFLNIVAVGLLVYVYKSSNE